MNGIGANESAGNRYVGNTCFYLQVSAGISKYECVQGKNCS